VYAERKHSVYGARSVDVSAFKSGSKASGLPDLPSLIKSSSSPLTNSCQ